MNIDNNNLITYQIVKGKIASSEKILCECFDMLLNLKHARDNLDDALTMFQPKLAECLYELMTFYQELHREKDRLISIKGSFEKSEFSEIMRKNAQFSEIVSDVIEIGKSLGDAFAWFFFRDNRSELDKHFEHETTGLYVGGIGGRGELEFIKHASILDGLYVLYHGITTMLRIGDFSLYDLNLGIVGVGELKTKASDDGLQVSASITSKVNINLPEGNMLSPVEDQRKKLQKEFPKLEKQLAMHPVLLRPIESDHSSTLYTSYEYELIDQLSTSAPIIVNSDKSLMLFATWSQQESLFEVLSENKSIDNLPDDFAEKAKSLMDPPSPYNEVIISELTTQMDILRIPVLWWHIDDDICRDMYFKRVNITTLFNPAKLLQCFINHGFTVSELGRLDKIELFKTENKHRISIGHFESLCDLIKQSLMRTEDVFAFSNTVASAIENGMYQSGTRIDMHVHLNSFGDKHK